MTGRRFRGRLAGRLVGDLGGDADGDQGLGDVVGQVNLVAFFEVLRDVDRSAVGRGPLGEGRGQVGPGRPQNVHAHCPTLPMMTPNRPAPRRFPPEPTRRRSTERRRGTLVGRCRSRGSRGGTFRVGPNRIGRFRWWGPRRRTGKPLQPRRAGRARRVGSTQPPSNPYRRGSTGTAWTGPDRPPGLRRYRPVAGCLRWWSTRPASS